MGEVARLAAEDAGVPGALPRMDSLSFIAVMSRDYGDDPRRLADLLGAQPADIVTTVYSADVPQTLLARLCGRIARGQSEIGLIVGAEAFYSTGKPDWGRLTNPDYAAARFPLHGETRAVTTALEQRYGLDSPGLIYPLFANAYRAARGLSLPQYMEELGSLCAEFSQVAALHPFAWSRDGKSAGELAGVSADNRMIHYPFTKYMNANMNVDQAAALLVMSEARAEALGVPRAKRVYLWGHGEAHETWHLSHRVNYHTSPALAVAGREAFAQAGLAPEDISWVDYYSCFPVAVQIEKDTLGLHPDLSPTVTGGLPFFGGAGTHYALHALCAMVHLLRVSPEKRGLVQSLSWFMSKFAVGILSGERPPAFTQRDPAQYRYEAEARHIPPKVLEKPPAGSAKSHEFRVETYTVSFARDGTPRRAVLIATTERGERIFAGNEDDTGLMRSMTEEEPIGKAVRIIHDDTTGFNRFDDLR
jgi:acetyl-CoA C-acetyltransferase